MNGRVEVKNASLSELEIPSGFETEDWVRTEELLSGIETEDREAVRGMFSRNREGELGSERGVSTPCSPMRGMSEDEQMPILGKESPTRNKHYSSGEGVGMFVGTEGSEAESGEYESLDYEPITNAVFTKSALADTESFFSRDARMRWAMTFAIGVMVGVLAFGMDMAVDGLEKVKWMAQMAVIHLCEACFIYPLLVLVAVCVLFAFISACLVALVEPVAAGSGIPEVKCYLNGIKIPHVTRFKTLFCKVVGVAFSVAAGLAVGKEGPMIHSGAVVAAGVSQGSSQSFGFDTGYFKRFRSDADKRDFVAGGSAAGVAAAFGAPIGGVMFALEEGASHWNQVLTWRTFFCAVVATFTLNFLLSCEEPDTSDPLAGSGCGFFFKRWADHIRGLSEHQWLDNCPTALLPSSGGDRRCFGGHV
mmetsp:Transcript_962/g.2502  ORF Transcript_962/g.2502 Transcript_962/m.2502 type:complete len:419 (+) Transcript_962:140-1396(+)